MKRQMAKGNGKKMEAKQFTISEELTPNRVEKKKTTIESTQKWIRNKIKSYQFLVQNH